MCYTYCRWTAVKMQSFITVFYSEHFPSRALQQRWYVDIFEEKSVNITI